MYDAVEIIFESFNQQLVQVDFGVVSCWSSAVTVKVACSFDVTFFPYDEQTCDIEFGSWILDPTVVSLRKFYLLQSLIIHESLQWSPDIIPIF